MVIFWLENVLGVLEDHWVKLSYVSPRVNKRLKK